MKLDFVVCKRGVLCGKFFVYSVGCEFRVKLKAGFVLRDYVVAEIQNVLARTVVFVKADDFCRRVKREKFCKRIGFCALELVNYLVVIANNKYVFIFGTFGKFENDFVLRVVCVLVFIYKKILEFCTDAF